MTTLPLPRPQGARSWARTFVPTILAIAVGCSGPKLPKPRVSADDDPPAAAAAPAAASANRLAGPDSQTGSAAPRATPQGGPSTPAATGGATAPTTAEQQAALQHRREAVTQFRKLGIALEKYRGKHGRYPDQYLADPNGNPLLSWRVALLPYLGLDELYDEFRLDEPWSSLHNLALLRKIPDVYRSPERQDDKTSIQLVTGPLTAYPSPQGLTDRRCQDGLINTVFVADVHPELARPWTQPEDYVLNALQIQQDLFTHRLDGALVVFGGEVGTRLLPANLRDDRLLAVLTPSGKERIDGETLSRVLTPEPYAELLEALKKKPVNRQLANVIALVQNDPAAAEDAAAEGADGTHLDPDDLEAKSPRVVSFASNGSPAAGGSANSQGGAAAGGAPASGGTAGGEGGMGHGQVDPRLPVPDESLLSAASGELRKMYADDLKTARKVDERKTFAKKLLEESKSLVADPPAFYVICRAARDTAAGAGDLATALHATKQMRTTFAIDDFSTTIKVLEQASPHLTETSALHQLYDEALRLTTLALDRDDFAGARQAVRLAQGAARRSNKQEDLIAANQREDELNSARLAFQRIAPHLHTLLRLPQDPAASAAVGRYTALVKHDWEKGLPLLAQGDDAALAKLATADLAQPVEGDAQAELGDAWWDWSESTNSTLERHNARTRASLWYKRAVPTLGPSLIKVRAERRIAEIESPPKPKKPGQTAGR